MARFLIAGVLMATILLPGCGAGEAGTAAEVGQWPERVNVALDGRVGPPNVGLRMAVERGFFESFNLKVVTASPAYPRRLTSYLTSGMDQFGLVQLPQLVLAVDRGAPLVAVGSLVSEPNAAMIWLESSRIEGIADLAGKTIAILGAPYQEALLQAVLRGGGLTLQDVEIKRVDYGLVPALSSGRADAIFGGSWNVEGEVLEARGMDPVIARVTELGIPPYDELVVVTRRDLVAEHPELVREFMSGAVRGTIAAARDPRAAVRVIEKSPELDPELQSEETRAGVEATLPLLSTSGRLNLRRAAEMVRWMHEEGLIQSQPAVSGLFTNDYLPDAGQPDTP